MKNLFYIILSIFLFQTLSAQVEPIITFDSLTGNYIIRYQGLEGEVHEVIFEPATKIEPQVNALVSFELDSSIFRYEYIVKNEAGSQQRLLAFSVEFYSPIFSITNPNQEWDSDKFSSLPIFDWAHTRVNPFGVKTAFNGIAPDSSMSGFSFRSIGLPAIVTSYFRGSTRTLMFPEEPPGGIEFQLEHLRRFPNNTVKGKTLGPKDPPDPFSVDEFLDTLISYKHQAFDLGWIDNQGIVNSLDAKLKNAKKQLEKGKTKQVINALGAFVNQVQAQKDKHLSSEAYALLKYNAEYLIEKLSEE